MAVCFGQLLSTANGSIKTGALMIYRSAARLYIFDSQCLQCDQVYDRE